MGGVQCSPAISQAQFKIEYLKGIKTKQTGGRFSSRKLIRLQRKAGILTTTYTSIEDIDKQIKEAYMSYYSKKKQAHSLRTNFL